jgi:two-component system chemotaxis sensor kinase CheA
MLDRIRSGQPIPPRLAIDLVFDSTTLLRELGTYIQQTLATHCELQLHAGVPQLLVRLRQAIEGKLENAEYPVQPAEPGEKLGEILVREGVVGAATITKVLQTQKSTGQKLGQALISQSQVPPKAVAHALRAQQMSSEVNSKLKEVVKVDLERVDNLVEAIGELVIVESMVSNAPEIRLLPAHLRNYLGQFAKITRELQELGMCMRMVPVRAEFQKMTRIMRDLARRSNKQVRMELSGEGTEMDRVMVEQIADPLVHLIRNAMDHGIEPVEDRRAAGKPDTGTVRLSACHEGGSIIIEITDDGRGINRERVLAKAISQSIIDKNATLSDAQIFDLLFAPGFSTAQQVTEISGRGVGMDVVKRNIEAVRGRIITSSTPGRGTTFRLVLPLTLAIIDGMVIRCGDERFILPTLNIVESLQPTADMLFSISGTNEHILVRGQTLPLVRLNRLLDVSGSENEPTKALVIIVESLRTQIALLVDEVVMKQQVVIKTLNHDLDSSRIFAGAAILSNGRVGLIVNVESLIDVSRERIALAIEPSANEKNRKTLSIN